MRQPILPNGSEYAHAHKHEKSSVNMGRIFCCWSVAPESSFKRPPRSHPRRMPPSRNLPAPSLPKAPLMACAMEASSKDALSLKLPETFLQHRGECLIFGATFDTTPSIYLVFNIWSTTPQDKK